MAYTVFLDHDERSKLAMGSFEQTITQFQFGTHNVQGVGDFGLSAAHGGGAVTATKELVMNHCVAELMIGVKPARYEPTDPADITAANSQNFDQRYNTAVPINELEFRGLNSVTYGQLVGGTTGGAAGVVSSFAENGCVEVGPIRTFALKFNGQYRVDTLPGDFFHYVLPYGVHTNIPEKYIYVWSFALDPEDSGVTGAANFSRIDKVDIEASIDGRALYNTSTFANGGTPQEPVNIIAPPTTQGSATIIVVGLSYNIVKYSHGLGAVKLGS